MDYKIIVHHHKHHSKSLDTNKFVKFEAPQGFVCNSSSPSLFFCTKAKQITQTPPIKLSHFGYRTLFDRLLSDVNEGAIGSSIITMKEAFSASLRYCTVPFMILTSFWLM